MASALARRSNAPAKKASTSRAPSKMRARGAQIVQVVRSGGGRAVAAARRAAGNEQTKSLALGCVGAAAAGAVATKIPLPPSVTNTVPKPALIGAGLVAGGLIAKGKMGKILTQLGAGPLFAGAYQLGEKAGAAVLSGEDVGYSDEVPGSAVAGEFDDLH